MGSWGRRSSALVLVCTVACGGGASTGTPPGVSAGAPGEAPVWEFNSLDARPVSSAAFMGKPAVLVFVTTYDPICQQQVNYDVPLAAELPDVTFALVALQDVSSRELVELYRDTLKVKFPVAIADAATIAGGGVLGDVHRIPATVILAKDGRVVWRHEGGVMPAELRSRLEKVQR
jgi:hypothetical protein